MAVLNYVTSGYRANLEEQDDPVIWIIGAMSSGGADLAILLGGEAAGYVNKSQRVSPLVIGDRRQANAPNLAGDIERLVKRGLKVAVVEEDFSRLGLTKNQNIVEGVQFVRRGEIPEHFSQFETVWFW